MNTVSSLPGGVWVPFIVAYSTDPSVATTTNVSRPESFASVAKNRDGLVNAVECNVITRALIFVEECGVYASSYRSNTLMSVAQKSQEDLLEKEPLIEDAAVLARKINNKFTGLAAQTTGHLYVLAARVNKATTDTLFHDLLHSEDLSDTDPIKIAAKRLWNMTSEGSNRSIHDRRAWLIITAFNLRLSGKSAPKKYYISELVPNETIKDLTETFLDLLDSEV
jgi:hypothetical protein